MIECDMKSNCSKVFYLGTKRLIIIVMLNCEFCEICALLLRYNVKPNNKIFFNDIVYSLNCRVVVNIIIFILSPLKKKKLSCWSLLADSQQSSNKLNEKKRKRRFIYLQSDRERVCIEIQEIVEFQIMEVGPLML